MEKYEELKDKEIKDGEILRNIRKARKLTQIDLASGIVTSQTVSAFEKGDSEPNYKAFCAMVKNAGSTLEEFEYEMNGFELSEFWSVLEEARLL